MTLLESLEEVLVQRLFSTLPVGSAVSTLRDAFDRTGASIQVLVSYHSSEYSHEACFRRRKAKFMVQVDCSETDLHPVLQSCLSNLDKFTPLVDAVAVGTFRAVSELVERKESILIGMQVYEIDIIG